MSMMIKNMPRLSLLFIVLTLFEIISGSADVQAADFSAPLIELPISNLQEKSASVRQIAVKVEDENGVVSVKIHYRTIGEDSSYNTLPLLPSANAAIYTVDLPAEAFIEPGIEYYIEARDVANNVSQSPFPGTPRRIAVNKALQTIVQSSDKKINWWWVALGVAAAGAALSSAGDDGSETASGSIGGPLPVLP